MIVSVAVTLCVVAQEVSVKRFEVATFDISASTEQRLDLNGDACALLKVQFPVEDIKFEGNVVGPCEFRSGEYWVYLTTGSRQLVVKHNRLMPTSIRFADHGVTSLEGKVTYIMQLDAPALTQFSDDRINQLQSDLEALKAQLQAAMGGDAAPTTPAVPVLSQKSVETFTVNGVIFEMVRVDGGSFMMGSNNGEDCEKPVHSETVGTFYIGKTEVTQALWTAVMGSNPSYFKGPNLPVENVSWNDCQEFIDRLNRITGRIFRLPTEAEWEYAARGGNRSRGYEYSGSNNLQSVGWDYDNSGISTHPVGSKLDNELGLYDMSGNVYEWTSDLWSSNYSSDRNGGASGLNRVIRGGGYSSGAGSCRSALRSYFDSGYRYMFLGFRLAL